jgi:sugar phosphate isomerase/epimerase
VHPRLAVSAVCSWNWSAAEDLEFWQRAGIGHVGLNVRKLEEAGWDEAVAAVRRAGLVVSSVGTVGYFALDRPERWAPARARVERALDAAAHLGAGCVVAVSGGAGRLTWEAAADALAEALAPAVAASTRLGVPLALENTASLRTDYSFVHTLRDADDLAVAMGVGVCMEVQSCWAERALAATVLQSVGDIRLVQVSDFVSGSSTSPDRAVVGDGDIPFERVIGYLVEAGYGGPFEIELFGPRIEAAGYGDAILRSIDHLEAVLDRVGV